MTELVYFLLHFQVRVCQNHTLNREREGGREGGGREGGGRDRETAGETGRYTDMHTHNQRNMFKHTIYGNKQCTAAIMLTTPSMHV